MKWFYSTQDLVVFCFVVLGKYLSQLSLGGAMVVQLLLVYLHKALIICKAMGWNAGQSKQKICLGKPLRLCWQCVNIQRQKSIVRYIFAQVLLALYIITKLRVCGFTSVFLYMYIRNKIKICILHTLTVISQLWLMLTFPALKNINFVCVCELGMLTFQLMWVIEWFNLIMQWAVKYWHRQ